MKKKLQNIHLAKKVGKTSYIKVDWKDWKKERPPRGEKVFVIVRLTNGYYPVFGEYLEWTSEKTMSKEEQPPITFRFVRFDSISMPEIYLGSKDEKRLIAWGAMEDYKPTTES